MFLRLTPALKTVARWRKLRVTGLKTSEFLASRSSEPKCRNGLCFLSVLMRKPRSFTRGGCMASCCRSRRRVWAVVRLGSIFLETPCRRGPKSEGIQTPQSIPCVICASLISPVSSLRPWLIFMVFCKRPMRSQTSAMHPSWYGKAIALRLSVLRYVSEA